MDRRVWRTSDHDSNMLLDITRKHLQLTKQALDKDTTPDRRAAIKAEIDALRDQRDDILSKYN